MSQQWYFITGGDKKGPVEWSDLQRLAATGDLGPADLVWNVEMPQFVPASQAPGLWSGTTTDGAVANSANMAMNSDWRQTPMASSFHTGQSGDVVYAGFFLRALAYIADGFLLLLIMLPVLIGFVWMTGAADDATLKALVTAVKNINRNPTAGLMLRLLLACVAWLYFAYQESGGAQATLGKRFLGLVVTDTNGQRISFARASGRHFGKIVSQMMFLIGYIMAGVTERKQALHDMMASCLVVIKPD
jgi:uncharacterized RDD family membrane protein YckC